MLPSRTPSRGKVAVALSLSLVLHGLGALAWIASRDSGVDGPAGFDARVDSPGDDDRFSVRLLDPPKREFVVQGKTQPAEKPPSPLPPSVRDVIPPSGPRIGAPTASGGSPESPTATGSRPKGSRILGDKAPNGTVVFVLDRSSSMGVDGLLPRAIAETRAAVGQLDQKSRFQVVAYNGGATSFPRGAQCPTPEGITDLGNWLATLRAEGRSDHQAGVLEALTFRPTHIFLLTDADDLDAREANSLGKVLRGGVELNVIVFRDAGIRPAGPTPLESLSQAHGGRVRYLDP